MTNDDDPEYQWGGVFEGRGFGWMSYDTEEEARSEVERCPSKYAPAYPARRTLGPIERIA